MQPDSRTRLVRRLAALVVLAQESRYLPSLVRLADEHQCSTRTIRRDLEAIEAVLPVRWRAKESA